MVTLIFQKQYKTYSTSIEVNLVSLLFDKDIQSALNSNSVQFLFCWETVLVQSDPAVYT